MGIIGSQGVARPENALDQLNISYWRTVIDLAVASGQDEREWCRANAAAINSYEKYRELLKEESAVQPGQHTQRKAVIGKDRSRYIEITRDGRAASIEESVVSGDAISNPEHRNQHKEAAVDDGREPGMVIECGKSRICIYAGISELMLHSVVKAVMANA